MEKPKIDFSKYTIPDVNKNLLLMMMKKIHNIFIENNIKYFIDGGTLLGAVRHGGFIPWDDDIDIGIFDKDFEKIMPLLHSKLIGDDIQIYLRRSNNNMIKIYVPNLWFKNIQTGQIIGTPTIDIFKYTYHKISNKIKLACLEERKRFPNCYHFKNDFYPLKEYQFDNIIVMGPSNPIPYLKRYYGDDCLTNYKIDIRKEENAQNKDRNAIEQTLNEVKEFYN